jgi:transcriptional regulator with XRE-family HTH domain
MSTVVAIEELGRRIRTLRMDLRMTLKQVEHASGLSATHLSEIERGRTSPTVGALVRLARALEKEPAYFLEPEERPEISHTVAGTAALRALAPGVSAECLAPGIPGGTLHAYRLRFAASGGATLELDAQEMPGEATYLVREGAIEAAFGEASVTLGPGDAVQASLGMPQRLRAAGAPAEVIAILSRPLTEAP